MKLAFREYGSGVPLIILHGLFGQSDNWNTMAKKFAGEGFRVFAVDQRNHGLSPHSEHFSYELMAQDLNEFIREHGLQSPVLLGHSMGGKTVLFHESLFPGTASKLIIADMAARAYNRHHDQVLEALNAVNFEDTKTRGDVEQILTKFIDDWGTRQFLLKNVHWLEGYENRLAWRFNLQSITQNYGRINDAVPDFKSATPALIIRGEKSAYVKPADETDFHNRFSECQVATIPGAGHWVHAEKPDLFFEAVYRFITA